MSIKSLYIKAGLEHLDDTATAEEGWDAIDAMMREQRQIFSDAKAAWVALSDGADEDLIGSAENNAMDTLIELGVDLSTVDPYATPEYWVFATETLQMLFDYA